MSDTAKSCPGPQGPLALPAFNIPYLPMMEPVIRAVADQDSFALVEVARLEWIKFEAGSPAAIKEEFDRWQNPGHVRLHLDHVPVIDEDGLRVDYPAELQRRSTWATPRSWSTARGCRWRRTSPPPGRSPRWPTRRRAVRGRAGRGAGPRGRAAAALRGAVRLRQGFTDVAEAPRSCRRRGCDWLSVAVGNIHGAIAAGLKDQARSRPGSPWTPRGARRGHGVPLVLHGGSGIRQEDVLARSSAASPRSTSAPRSASPTR